MLAGARITGQILYYASKSLRDDKDMVLTAVSTKGIILKYASKRLRQDKDVAIAAVKQNKKAFEYIDDSIKNEDTIQKIVNSTE